jgi:hypothetical protein
MRRFLRLVPAALLIASLAVLALSRPGDTVPLFAARQGLMCQNCHFDPNGGGPRNDFGFAYARNRHSVDPEDSTSQWADLDLTNKIGETMPLYVGLNHRFMLLDNNTASVDGLDRLGFFNMENAIHLAFQPHHRLALVYTTDAFSSGPTPPGIGTAPAVRSKEAFGMISGFPFNGYFRAGRFRVPFGLRMDDHTVATRNSFLDFSGGGAFLPFDPRDPDMGFEVGGSNASWFGRASFTNGDAQVFGGGFAEAKTVKLGFNSPRHQSGVSFYDNYNSERGGLSPSFPKRATRWGYYGLGSFGPLAGIVEVAAGTDEAEPDPGSGLATGPKTNSLAWFAEVDYTPMRFLNGRLRYDYLQLDRSSDPVIRDASTHRRYAAEAEYLPVPFAELRAVIRWIDHEDVALHDEAQGYLQFHFSY